MRFPNDDGHRTKRARVGVSAQRRRTGGRRGGGSRCATVLLGAWAAVASVSSLALPGLAMAAVPARVSYQGELLRNGAPFDGTAQMKFVVFDEDQTIWSHDGTSTEGSEPTGSVSVPVAEGVFTVLLGDVGMVPFSSTILAGAADPKLRLWVDSGDGFEQLPDQPIASSAYAISAQSAQKSEFDFRANGIIWSMSGGFRFPDGTIQTTASVGGGGGVTLDQAYDFGGAGAGRTITADAGAVNVAGPDGLRVNGSLGVGMTSTPPARLAVGNVGGVDDVKLLAFDEAIGTEFVFEGDFAGSGNTGNRIALHSAWTNDIQVWRGDGHVGFGVAPGSAQVAIGNNATSVGSPALVVFNLNTGDAYGFAATTLGSGPAATLQSVSGDHLRFIGSGGSTIARVDNAGRGHFPSLQNVAGTTVLDTSGRWRMTGAFGSGVAGAPLFAENTTSNGIAFWGRVAGTDATAVLEQNGTGSLLRAFKSGSLKFEVQNSGRVVTTALQITGGGDLAEPFTVTGGPVPAGTVLVIDEERAGQLKPSTGAYDRRVAGIVSGAGGLAPGITLEPSAHQQGGQQVALTGRVYARADATNGAIRPGDLLTTADRAGHVMKAADPTRASGAVLGKAMTALESGTGLVLVLVSLQ